MPYESGARAKVFYPIVVADEWGGAHAFWSASYEEDAGTGDTVFYSSWDGVAWSTPADILYTPGESTWIPKAAVDSEGWIHLMWTDNPTGQIWYTRAAISDARSALAWDQPRPVVAELASGLSLAVDADGVLHLVYCMPGVGQGVYHASSEDGENWSAPAYVGQVGDSVYDYLECSLSQDIDARGRLHTVWGQALDQDTPIYYSRSEDAGASWLPPQEIDRMDERYKGSYTPGRPSILAVGEDEVHVVWFGAPYGQRWHRWSADGGDTWSSAEQISPLLRGYMEPPALAADSSGTVHLISMGWLDTEEPKWGAFHTYWRDGGWSSLALIRNELAGENLSEDSGRRGGEFAAIAVVRGNISHVIWEFRFAGIWASSLQVNAPPVLPEKRSASEATRTVQSEDSDKTAPRPATAPVTTVPTATDNVTPSEVKSEGGYSLELAILISILPAALLVGLVLLVLYVRRRS